MTDAAQGQADVANNGTRLALDSHAASPDDPGATGAGPSQEGRAAQVRRAEILVAAAGAERDAWLLELRSPAPGQESYLTNEIMNALNASAEAAYRELAAAEDAAAAVPARVRPGDPGLGIVRLEAEVKQTTTPSGWLPTTPKPPWPSRMRARLRNAISRKTTVRLTRGVPRRSGRAWHPVPQGWSRRARRPCPPGACERRAILKVGEVIDVDQRRDQPAMDGVVD